MIKNNIHLKDRIMPKYESTQRYRVVVGKCGSAVISAHSPWEAIEIALTRYRHIESDRNEYTASKQVNKKGKLYRISCSSKLVINHLKQTL